MRQRLVFATLAAALVFAAAPATAQIYKWKDAKGVTKYSESPPPKGAYTVQEMPRAAPAASPSGASSTAATPPTAATGASADPRCDTARRNMVALQGKGSVAQAAGSDGKPGRALTEAERASELELTRATLKAYNCAEPGAPAAAGTSAART